MERKNLARYARLSLAASVITLALKFGAYWLTNSVGLLSDAIESLVNLAAAAVMLVMLVIAARPPDNEHAFGHDKAEFFSSGVEGALIVVAAIGIAVTAIERWITPQPVDVTVPGTVAAVAASVLNLAVARLLMRVGTREGSISLQADAQHLLTDVWTSVGVLVGLVAVALTGWTWLDGLIALAIAINIVRQGVQLVRRSALGLLDSALSSADQLAITSILDSYAAQNVTYHALRTRQSGARKFVTVHILVPGSWSVQTGHNMLEKIEHDLHAILPHFVITTHLEPVDAPESFADAGLDAAS